MQGFAPGAESQNRTGDTALFRRVLYRLSYLGDGSGFRRRADETSRCARAAAASAFRFA